MPGTARTGRFSTSSSFVIFTRPMWTVQRAVTNPARLGARGGTGRVDHPADRHPLGPSGRLVHRHAPGGALRLCERDRGLLPHARMAHARHSEPPRTASLASGRVPGNRRVPRRARFRAREPRHALRVPARDRRVSGPGAEPPACTRTADDRAALRRVDQRQAVRRLSGARRGSSSGCNRVGTKRDRRLGDRARRRRVRVRPGRPQIGHQSRRPRDD